MIWPRNEKENCQFCRFASEMEGVGCPEKKSGSLMKLVMDLSLETDNVPVSSSNISKGAK